MIRFEIVFHWWKQWFARCMLRFIKLYAGIWLSVSDTVLLQFWNKFDIWLFGYHKMFSYKETVEIWCYHFRNKRWNILCKCGWWLDSSTHFRLLSCIVCIHSNDLYCTLSHSFIKSETGCNLLWPGVSLCSIAQVCMASDVWFFAIIALVLLFLYDILMETQAFSCLMHLRLKFLK